MKMRKIVAIAAAVLMLFSVIPFSAMAADTTVVFELGANGSASHNDGSSKTTYSETVDGYTLSITGGTKMYTGARDAKGNSCIKLGTSSAAGSFTISSIPDDVTAVVIAVAAYKAKTATMNINGTTTTLTTKSDNGQYDEITVDTTSTKSISVKVSSGYRAMVNTITYVIPAGNADCDHSQYTCGDTCEVCGTVFEHEYSQPCTEMCENDCGTANPDAVAHTYSHSLASFCSVCGDERTVVMPTDPAELVDAAYALPANEAFPEAVTLTGIISSVDTAFNSSYNNVTVTIDVLDSEGNVIADKPIQCFRLKGTGADIIAEGDTITVSGIIKNYNGNTIEFDANCTLISYEQTGCEHEYSCTTVDPTCTKDGSATYVCDLCGKTYTETLPANGHDYVDDVCTVCGTVKPTGYTPITSADQFVSGEYVMVVETGYAPTYFESGWVLTGQPAITNDVISADDAAGYLWTLTVNGSSVTITDANGVTIAPKSGNNNGIQAKDYSWSWIFEDGKFIFAGAGSDTTYLASNTATGESGGLNRFRAYKTTTVNGNTKTYLHQFTLYAASTSTQPDKPECAHQWNAATCTEPATCALCGAVDGEALGHDWEIISQQEATCTAGGSIVYECATCGEDKSETFPALLHTYVDGICSGCGAELPLESTITFDADKTQRYEFGNESQTWANTGLVLINNKGSYNQNLGDYSNPLRMYKGTEIIISFPGMTSLVIDGPASADYAWDDTLAGYTFTKADGVYTITFAEPTDSITLTAANQVRANKITATRVVPCAHEYDNACDVDCNLCYETREVSHNVVHVEAKAATCTAEGNIEYWFCDVCGAAWLDEACTLNTNLKAVKLPMAEHTYDDEYDADCNVCGDVREVPEKPDDEILYGDANGDGEITLMDATLLSQYLSGYDVEVDLVTGDANGDGEITLMDATLLSQYLSGYDVTLGPAEDAPLFNDGELGGW